MPDKHQNNTIILSGEKSLYAESVEGNVNVIYNITLEESTLTEEQILTNLQLASVDLSSYDNCFQNDIHFEREETKKLLEWVNKELDNKETSVALLVGNAGSGKSVILKDLLISLNSNNIPALGVKVDKLLNVKSPIDLEKILNLGDKIIPIFQTLTKTHPKVVILIDQIDALSQSLSSDRTAINLYDRLIKQLRCLPNLRIIVSCRTYDLNYDPILNSYGRETIIRVSLLEVEQVDFVLSKNQITVNKKSKKLREFLRLPLHLKLFCKVGTCRQFDDGITLQKLYDEIWEEFVSTYPKQHDKDSERIRTLLTLIAEKMNQQQQIVVDKRQFETFQYELSYLLHQELLYESSTNKIQFIHQTFFDYAYARIFVTSGQSITSKLKQEHQGLFIRSQVKQIFGFLRDYDHSKYIQELSTVLFDDGYRFHIQLLLITDLGFYAEPIEIEKRFVKNKIIPNPFYFRLFLESIQSPVWFEHITNNFDFTQYLAESTNNTDVMINTCTRIIWQAPHMAIAFLSLHSNNIRLIENVLCQVPQKEIDATYTLYNQTVDRWDGWHKYHFLEKSIEDNPDFVIENLKKDFDKNIKTVTQYSREFIPGGHDAERLIGKLFEQHPVKALPYFIYVLEQIMLLRRDNFHKEISDDLEFYDFVPLTNDSHYIQEKIYDMIFAFIKGGHDTVLDNIFLPLVHSKLANLLSISVFFLLQNTEKYINEVFDLLITDNFLIDYDASNILRYYTKELLNKSYPLLSNDKQIILNKQILTAIPEAHKKKNSWVKKGVSQFGYTRYFYNPYSLISMIPEDYRNRYTELKKTYQEGFRKYMHVTNEKLRPTVIHVGERALPEKAYENMTLKLWKTSFKKLNQDLSLDNWKKPSMGGNMRRFADYVSKEPNKYAILVNEIIHEKDIPINYILAGLEGLEKGKYDTSLYQDICLNVLSHREKELKDYEISSFLRYIRYAIRNSITLHPNLFNYIQNIALKFPDRSLDEENNFLYRDNQNQKRKIIEIGINSVRGTAVENIVECYRFPNYKEDIFSTLEYIADNANEATRACAIMRGALLNNLDKNRNLDLFLRLIKDHNPDLLALPVHDLHPLLYLMYVNFKHLMDIFIAGINVEDAAKPMSHFLLNAYLHDIPKSYSLLMSLIHKNSVARQELAWVICDELLDKEKYLKKGWKILKHLLKFDDQELGKKFDNCFLHIPPKYSLYLESFILKYLSSPIGRYRGNYFYEFLLKIIPEAPEQCLDWFFKSNPEIPLEEWHIYHHPVNVLIESYNCIRKYEPHNPLLEKAMDMFDTMLKTPQHRSGHINEFLQELAS